MFNVAVSHCGIIYNISGPHPGSRNDKTAVRYDDFVMGIHKNEVLDDVEWQYMDGNGDWHTETGCWLLADGGYHRWRYVRSSSPPTPPSPLLPIVHLLSLLLFLYSCLQCPVRWTDAACKVAWSDWAESVRKDVECVFGLLKQRWRSLKYPSRFQTQVSCRGHTRTHSRTHTRMNIMLHHAHTRSIQ